MRVAIHQPEHLPWLGLLAKIAQSDLWIVLDSVPYRKNYFQNRNRLLLDGVPTWLTVPVCAPFGTLIQDVRVAEDPQWRRRYHGRLRQALAHCPPDGRLDRLSGVLDAAMAHRQLCQLNLAVTGWLLSEFGVTTPLVQASTLAAGGAKSELIRNLCLAAGADEYLAGPSGRSYLDLVDFAEHGIKVFFFDYDHPAYDQGCPFVSQLSSVDAWSRLAPAELPVLLSSYQVDTS